MSTLRRTHGWAMARRGWGIGAVALFACGGGTLTARDAGVVDPPVIPADAGPVAVHPDAGPPPIPDAGPPPVTPTSPVAAENALPGTEARVTTHVAGPGRLEGYAGDVRVNHGDAVDMHVSADVPTDVHWELYRMGWYGGKGGRLIATGGPFAVAHQPAPAVNPATGLVECAWAVSLVLHTDRSWVSGIYMLNLIRADGLRRFVPIVVRDDERKNAAVIQASVATWQAYNDWGGESLYSDALGLVGGHAREVSFDRPYTDGFGAGEFFNFEDSLVQWVESHGYDVTYLTNVDVHRDPSLLAGQRLFISSGHDEYWSRGEKDTVESAIAGGAIAGRCADPRAIARGELRFRRARAELAQLDRVRDAIRRLRLCRRRRAVGVRAGADRRRRRSGAADDLQPLPPRRSFTEASWRQLRCRLRAAGRRVACGKLGIDARGGLWRGGIRRRSRFAGALPAARGDRGGCQRKPLRCRHGQSCDLHDRERCGPHRDHDRGNGIARAWHGSGAASRLQASVRDRDRPRRRALRGGFREQPDRPHRHRLRADRQRVGGVAERLRRQSGRPRHRGALDDAERDHRGGKRSLRRRRGPHAALPDRCRADGRHPGRRAGLSERTRCHRDDPQADRHRRQCGRPLCGGNRQPLHPSRRTRRDSFGEHRRGKRILRGLRRWARGQGEVDASRRRGRARDRAA